MTTFWDLAEVFACHPGSFHGYDTPNYQPLFDNNAPEMVMRVADNDECHLMLICCLRSSDSIIGPDNLYDLEAEEGKFKHYFAWGGRNFKDITGVTVDEFDVMYTEKMSEAGREEIDEDYIREWMIKDLLGIPGDADTNGINV